MTHSSLNISSSSPQISSHQVEPTPLSADPSSSICEKIKYFISHFICFQRASMPLADRAVVLHSFSLQIGDGMHGQLDQQQLVIHTDHKTHRIMHALIEAILPESCIWTLAPFLPNAYTKIVVSAPTNEDNAPRSFEAILAFCLIALQKHNGLVRIGDDPTIHNIATEEGYNAYITALTAESIIAAPSIARTWSLPLYEEAIPIRYRLET